MGRKSSIEEKELIARLRDVFREVGYEGATLSLLSAATGLKKASLYHRFPEGKEQMAREVLEATGKWLEEHILAPLRARGKPASRIAGMAKKLDEFYSGGRQSCLLNMLSSSRIEEGPFTRLIEGVFSAWIGALSSTLTDAGIERKTARSRAERAVVMIQGSLVYSRGTGSSRPFREYLTSLPEELLETE